MAQTKKVWFGTEGFMRWIKAPATNMGRALRPWESGTSYLNGGYSQISSNYAAMTYTMNWNVLDSETKNIIQGYANKAYGTGLIYFSDPFTHDNVVPLFWSAAHLTATDAPSLVEDYRPTTAAVSNNGANFPPRAAVYALGTGAVPIETRVPLPRGYNMLYAAFGTRTGTAAVQVGTNLSGTPTYTDAAMVSTANTEIGIAGYQVVTNFNGDNDLVSFRLAGEGQLNLVGVHAYIYPTSEVARTFTYFPLGEGNTGLRFEGSPQITAYSSVLDQQAMSATLVETGVWE